MRVTEEGEGVDCFANGVADIVQSSYHLFSWLYTVQVTLKLPHLVLFNINAETALAMKSIIQSRIEQRQNAGPRLVKCSPLQAPNVTPLVEAKHAQYARTGFGVNEVLDSDVLHSEES